jgi:hypothetical protein
VTLWLSALSRLPRDTEVTLHDIMMTLKGRRAGVGWHSFFTYVI